VERAIEQFETELAKMPMDEFLAPATVARKLKLSTRCLRYLMRTKRLPAMKVGRQWRIPALVLLQWVRTTWKEHRAENKPSNELI
jgi:excisionase family DNA binding protein